MSQHQPYYYYISPFLFFFFWNGCWSNAPDFFNAHLNLLCMHTIFNRTTHLHGIIFEKFLKRTNRWNDQINTFFNTQSIGFCKRSIKMSIFLSLSLSLSLVHSFTRSFFRVTAMKLVTSYKSILVFFSTLVSLKQCMLQMLSFIKIYLYIHSTIYSSIYFVYCHCCFVCWFFFSFVLLLFDVVLCFSFYLVVSFYLLCHTLPFTSSMSFFAVVLPCVCIFFLKPFFNFQFVNYLRYFINVKC